MQKRIHHILLPIFLLAGLVGCKESSESAGSDIDDAGSHIADSGKDFTDAAPDGSDANADHTDAATDETDAATDGTDAGPDTTIPDPVITTFSFDAAKNDELRHSIEGTLTGALITVAVPYWVDLTRLVPTFVASDNSVVTVEATVQESGVTSNDFTGDVTYVVKAADDDTASYVVSVSKAPFAPMEISRLQASDAEANDGFYQTSLRGDTSLVVARGADSPDGDLADRGAAYVLNRGTDRAWSESHILFASNPGDVKQFGFSYAAGDGAVIIGDPGQQAERGAAYIFQESSSGSWTEQILTAEDPFEYMAFSRSVGIDGDYAFVGTPWAGEPDYSNNAGAVYVYKSDVAGIWSLHQTLTASDGTGTDPYDQFGEALAVRAGRLIVGANMKTVDATTEAGGAYIFELNSTSGMWEEVAKLQAAEPQTRDGFGARVAIHDDYAVVGAPGRSAGPLFIFERGAAGTWTQVQVLSGDDLGMTPAAKPTDAFALDGDVLLIGHRTYKRGELDNSGRVLIFQRDAEGTWQNSTELLPSDPGRLYYFGTSVSVERGTVLVGAFRTGDDDPELAGAVYLFE